MQCFDATMSLPRRLNSRFFLRGFSLLLIAIALTPLHIQKTPFALAVGRPVDWPLGPDIRYSGSLESDYPDDKELLKVFTDPGADNYVLAADYEDLLLGQSGEYLYTKSVPGKKGLFDSWPRRGNTWHYCAPNGRSQRWFPDFWSRIERIFFEREAKGVVELLTRPEGPRRGFESRSCDHFFMFTFPALRANIKVSKIVKVHYNAWTVREDYWVRDVDPDDPDDEWYRRSNDPDRGGPTGGGNNIIEPPETYWQNKLGPAAAAVAGTLPPAAAAVLPVLPVLPAAAVGVGENLLDGLRGQDHQDQEGSQLNDVIDHPWPANIPDEPVEKQAMVPPGDPSVSFDSLWGRALGPRDLGGACRDYPEWGKLLDYYMKTQPKSSPDGKTQPQGLSDDNTFRLHADSQPGSPFIPPPVGQLWGALKSTFNGNVMKVDVVQTRLYQTATTDSTATCQLDVTVRDGSDQIVATQKGPVADTEELSVVSAKLPVPISVWWSSQDDQLHFRSGYGAAAWDSTEESDSHQCQVSAWQDDARTVSCTYPSANQ